MAHDSQCENANTPPSNCDCSCGGDEHGLGFVEEQVHDLETDSAAVRELQTLTPDDYFGDDAKGERLMVRLYGFVENRIKQLDGDTEELLQAQRDKERLESIAEACGKSIDTAQLVGDYLLREKDDNIEIDAPDGRLSLSDREARSLKTAIERVVDSDENLDATTVSGVRIESGSSTYNFSTNGVSMGLYPGEDEDILKALNKLLHQN